MDDEYKRDLYCTIFAIEYELARRDLPYDRAITQAESAALYSVGKYQQLFPY